MFTLDSKFTNLRKHCLISLAAATVAVALIGSGNPAHAMSFGRGFGGLRPMGNFHSTEIRHAPAGFGDMLSKRAKRRKPADQPNVHGHAGTPAGGDNGGWKPSQPGAKNAPAGGPKRPAGARWVKRKDDSDTWTPTGTRGLRGPNGTVRQAAPPQEDDPDIWKPTGTRGPRGSTEQPGHVEVHAPENGQPMDDLLRLLKLRDDEDRLLRILLDRYHRDLDRCLQEHDPEKCLKGNG